VACPSPAMMLRIIKPNYILQEKTLKRNEPEFKVPLEAFVRARPWISKPTKEK